MKLQAVLNNKKACLVNQVNILSTTYLHLLTVSGWAQKSILIMFVLNKNKVLR